MRSLQKLGIASVLCIGVLADDERGRRATAELLQAGREAAEFLGAPASRIAVALFDARMIQAADRRELEQRPEYIENCRGHICAQMNSICNAERRAKADLAELAAGIAAFDKPLVFSNRHWLLPWTRRKMHAAIEAEPETFVGLRALCFKRPGLRQTLYEIYLHASEEPMCTVVRRSAEVPEHPLDSMYAHIFCMFSFFNS